MRKTALSEIRDTLSELAIPPNRTVIVHSSLVKFGLVEGGAAGVLGVLQDALGPDATIVMPTFYLSFGATRIFDLSTTPSETGALTEHFRKLPGAKRSLHPFHSVSATGPLADEVVSGLCLSSFGLQSAFDRLYDLDALNLFIGTEFVGGATFLHAGEERANVPYRFMKSFPGEVRDGAGELVDETFKMFVRTVEDDYEYRIDWSGWWQDFSERECFKISEFAGAMFCVTEIKRTLDIFKELIEGDPFRHVKAHPRTSHV